MQAVAEEIEQFTDQGYLVLEALIPGDRCQRYREIFDELVERSRSLTGDGDGFHLAPDCDGRPTPGVLHKVQGVCVVEPRVLVLAREPGILEHVERLIGPNLDVFGTKFFPMHTPGATSTGWHQDNYYFGTQSERVVSCAIYLHPIGPDNGCLRVVPGSHRNGQLVSHRPGAGEYAHGAWTEVNEEQAVDILCPPGTVVLFSANLLHGARPNLSGRPAYRTAWHYIPADLDLPMFPRGGYRDRHILREG